MEEIRFSLDRSDVVCLGDTYATLLPELLSRAFKSEKGMYSCEMSPSRAPLTAVEYASYQIATDANVARNSDENNLLSVS